MKSKVYIAGPMRGHPQLNFPAFDAAKALGMSLGWDVISPADMDRNAGIDEQEAPAIEQEVGLNPSMLRVFVQRDIEALLSLRVENGDCIAMLPGWEKSVGATAENAVAKWLKLRVLDATTFYDLGYEPCYTCGDGACPTAYDITMQQAREIANIPYLPSLQSALDDEGSFAADIRRPPALDDEDSSVEDLRRNSSERYPLWG